MNTSTKIRTAATAAALLACAAFAAAAHAADAPRVVIRYRPAAVATEQGAKDLYRRIALAAAQVCPEDPAQGLGRVSPVQQCRQAAVDRAVGEIHERHLVEIAARTHRG